MKTCAQYQREYRERKKALGQPYCDSLRRIEYQKEYRLKQKELAKQQGLATLQKSPEQKANHAQQQRIYVKRKLQEGIDVNYQQNQKRQKNKNYEDQLPHIDIPTSEEQAGLDQITQAHLQQQAQAKQADELEHKTFLQNLTQPITQIDLAEDVANRDDSKCDF